MKSNVDWTKITQLNAERQQVIERIKVAVKSYAINSNELFEATSDPTTKTNFVKTKLASTKKKRTRNSFDKSTKARLAQEARELLKRGMGWNAVADELKTTTTNLRRWVAQHPKKKIKVS